MATSAKWISITMLVSLMALVFLAMTVAPVTSVALPGMAKSVLSANYSSQSLDGIDTAEIEMAFGTDKPLGKLAIANSAGEEVSVEAFKAAGNTNPCVPGIDSNCHALNDGERSKIASRVQAALESKGKPIVQCLARLASDGTANAITLVMEASFRGATSGSLYKGTSFLYNLEQPDRSTFMSLRRLKDGTYPGFQEIPVDDPRCAAALEFRDIMIGVLSAYQ